MAAFWVSTAVVLGANAALDLGMERGGDGAVFVTVVIGVVGFGVVGFRERVVFALERESLKGGTPAKGRYRRSGLRQEDAAVYLDRLDALMESERLYLKADLGVSDVARRLGVSRHHLTQALNERRGENFYQFLNGFRVREACRRMSDPRHAAETVLSIGFGSGFNSKSSFNAAFRRATSMTPSEYRQRCVGGDGLYRSVVRAGRVARASEPRG